MNKEKINELFSNVKIVEGGLKVTIRNNSNAQEIIDVIEQLKESKRYPYVYNFHTIPFTITFKSVNKPILTNNIIKFLSHRKDGIVKIYPTDLGFEDVILSGDACDIYNFNKVYFRRLCQASQKGLNCLVAVKRGKVWYVSENSIQEYRKEKYRNIIYQFLQYDEKYYTTIEIYLSKLNKEDFKMTKPKQVRASYIAWSIENGIHT